jgi:hypothetical protein
LANWTKKEDPTIYCLQETPHLIHRKRHWLMGKGWKMIYTKLIVPENRQK